MVEGVNGSTPSAEIVEESSQTRSSPHMLFLSVSHRLGQVAEVLQWKGDRGMTLSDKERALLLSRTKTFFDVFQEFTRQVGIDIMTVWRKKFQKVLKKYPPELCRGSADKYTAYIERIEQKEKSHNELPEVESEPPHKKLKADTENGDSTNQAMPQTDSQGWKPVSQDDVLETQGLLRKLAADRDWDQYHTPRNLLLALTGEVGEVAEELAKLEPSAQGKASWTNMDNLFALGEEIADCWSYTVRFCDTADLGLEKMV